MIRRSLMLFALTIVVVSANVRGGALARSTTGFTPASIQATVDQFRADLGGANNGVGGTFPSGRREINWDGVPDSASAPANLPADFFKVNSPRGVLFSTSGSGFQVSARSGNATATPVRFGNLNPTYPDDFQAFSPERLFSPIGSNVLDLFFFVPGTEKPAFVTGFGAVFSDVDLPASATLQFFDVSNVSLGTFSVPGAPGNQGVSFLGVSFTAGERIGHVRITSGALPLGGNDDPSGNDVVVMDDFIYGEPRPVSAGLAGCVSTDTNLCLFGARFDVRVQAGPPAQGAFQVARAVGITPDSGAFWFITPNNLELMVKVVDGRAFNGRMWVFIAAASNFDYRVEVFDSLLESSKTYVHSGGTVMSIADTGFPD